MDISELYTQFVIISSMYIICLINISHFWSNPSISDALVTSLTKHLSAIFKLFIYIWLYTDIQEIYGLQGSKRIYIKEATCDKSK